MNLSGHRSADVPLSILHINTHEKTGGAAKVAWRLAGIQRASGLQSRLLVGYKQSKLSYSDSFEIQPDRRLQECCRKKGYLFYEFQGSHELAQSPRVQAADIIHLHNLHGNYFNPFSLTLLANTKPIVWTLHDMQSFTGHCAHSFDCDLWQHGCSRCPYPDTEPGLREDTSEVLLSHKQMIYEHSPLWIVAPSKWIKSKVEKSILGLHPVELIHNGIDTDVFKPTNRANARRAFGLPLDKILIGTVTNGGALSNPWKGWEYTEAAVEFLHGQYPEICFVDIGGTNRTEDAMRLSIPHISDENMLAQAYSALDMFLYTPRADTCPLVVIEAMACGLPIISFDTGGIPEMIVDGEQGYVVRFQDVKALVQAVHHLLKHPSERIRMGDSARKRAQTCFNQEILANRYSRLYEKVMEKFPQRQSQFTCMPIDKVPELVRTPIFMKAYHKSCEMKITSPNAFANREDLIRNFQDVVEVKEAQFGRHVDEDQRFQSENAFSSWTINPKNVPPMISVITPSFNQSQYLEACIKSVLEQDYPNIEYIIMDGGSTDCSRSIIEKYTHRLAYWQSKPDDGHYWAVQEGIKRSSGEIITWLNSDDQFHPHAFRIVAALFMQRKDIEWITGKPNNINTDGTMYSEAATLPVWGRQKFLDRCYHRPFIQQEGTFWRRSLWDKAGGKLQANLALAGDMELWTRFFRHSPLHSVDYNFAAYRTHGDNRALKFMKQYLEEAEKVIEHELRLLKTGQYPNILDAPQRISKSQIAKHLLESGMHGTLSQRKKNVETPIKKRVSCPNPKVSIRLLPIENIQLKQKNIPVRERRLRKSRMDISLILPTKNRSKGLEEVLQSIPDAMDDIAYEIILYTDQANEQIERIRNAYPISKIFYDNEVFGPIEGFSWSKLMNHAFKHASGNWIMYASDDIVFYPKCFKNAFLRIENTSATDIGGISFLHRNTVETHRGVFKRFGYDTLNGDKAYINFGLINSTVFKKTEGFDEKLRFFWADVDICMQIWRSGYRIIPSQVSLVDHNNFLEKNQQVHRNELFQLDTARFLEKWGNSCLFKKANPLEKIRYFLDDKNHRQVVDYLQNETEKNKRRVYNNPLRIVIDAVIFQLQARNPKGISRVWENLIPEIAKQMPNAEIIVLKRKGTKVPVKGFSIKTIPAFRLEHEDILDADDWMLRKVCRDLKADVFISTYYTRAPGVINLVLLHDMIPEIFGFDMSQPEWLAKQRVIETGDAFICVSETTRNDLQRLYPQTRQRPIVVAHNGLAACFKPKDETDINHFRDRYRIEKKFLLMVGNRKGYKNAIPFLKSLARLPEASKFTVVCVGGEQSPISEETALKSHLDLRFIGQIEDSDLAVAYSGAEALLSSSKYEGFGLPVLEAMACGCPVVAVHCDAIAEIGGDAVCCIDDSRTTTIGKALQKISSGAQRHRMVSRGFARAKLFNWATAANGIGGLINQLSIKPAILLTAIVSTFNAQRFIQGCLEDLTAQTLFPQMEIVVVDSASEQNEALIIKKFQERFGNIKYIKTPARENVYSAWNRGIKVAKGKYVTNANTDDRHRRDALEIMVRELEAHPEVALVYADVIKTEIPNQTFNECNPTGMMRWHDWDREILLEKGCFIGPQPVWRRDVHDTYGFFDSQLTVCGDYEFWLRISQTNTFLHIKKPLGLYLNHPDSIEHSNQDIKSKENRIIQERYRKAAKLGSVIGLLNEDKRLNINSGTFHPDTGKTSPSPAIDSRKNQIKNRRGEKNMQSPESILNAIDTLVQSGQKDAACWFLDQFLSEFPGNGRANHLRAGLAYEQNDLQTALHHFEQAVAFEQANAEFQKSLGDIHYVVNKDALKALDHYERALLIVPDNEATLLTAGHLCVSLHRFDEARHNYKRVVELNPGHAEALGALAQLPSTVDQTPIKEVSADELYASVENEIENGHCDKAIAVLLKVVEIDNAHARAHNDLAVLYYDQGKKEEAYRHYTRACELMPESAVFQKNLADFLWADRNDAQGAMAKYVQVLKLEPQDIEAILGCAQICDAVGKQDDAREFLECALEIEPWNSDARQLMKQLENQFDRNNYSLDNNDLYLGAQKKATEGDQLGAIDDLNRLLEYSYDNPLIHNDLGVLYYEAGNKEMSLSCYQKAYQLAPDHPSIIKNLADFYLVEQERIEDAMRLYISVLEKTPEDIECLMATAHVCKLMGKPHDAKDFYHRILEIEPWNQDARKALDELEIDSHPFSGALLTKQAMGSR